MPVGDVLGAAQGVPQGRRCDDKPQPEHGQQRLGERANVDDAATGVERAQGLYRTAAEAKLTVVVVLDDRRAVRIGSGQ